MKPGEDVQATICNLNALFTGTKILEIPYFQRAYVWGEIQWARMLEDIVDVCKNPAPYFIGSVILKQQPTSVSARYGDIRTVIDGQQRITTLAIIIKVLCLKTGDMTPFNFRFTLNGKELAIHHNRNDKKAFDTIMGLTEIADIGQGDNVSRAYAYFVEKLDQTIVNLNIICNCFQLVGIDINAEEDEQQIFDTINSLGVKLTTPELLKNYFFSKNDSEMFDTYWLDVFEKDDEGATKAYWDTKITAGNKERQFIELFFYAFLQIKIQDESLKIKSDEKNEFAKVDRLFESYKQLIKDHYANDKKPLLAEIGEYAALFRKIFDASILDSELTPEPGKERLNAIIFRLDTTTPIPYILFIEHEVKGAAEKRELYACLESYIMRRLITKATNQNYTQLFSDQLISKNAVSKDDFYAIISGQDNNINRMPDDKEVKDAFMSAELINRYAAGVLYLIETKIRDQSKHSTQLLGISKYSLEHIMPKNWRSNWEFSGGAEDKRIRDKTLMTLGNLTIITQALNASIRDSCWSEKKSGRSGKGGLRAYSDGIATLSAWLDIDAWDEGAIQDRAKFLSDEALKIWAR